MKNNSNPNESIQTIAKTASSLSNAADSLSKCINNLAFDGSLVERIKPDLGYLQSVGQRVSLTTSVGELHLTR